MAASRSVLEDLPFCLARASLSFRRFGDQTLRSMGLDAQPPGMASVLHALDESGDCTVSALVDKTQLPNGTLTGLLDRLERDGYLQRVDNPKDGRSWIIRLTSRGEDLCAKLRLRHKKVMALFNEALPQTETAELKRLLEKLTSHLRGYVAGKETLPPSRRKAPRSARGR